MKKLDYGKYVLIFDEKGKNWLFKLTKGKIFHTHKGRIMHDDILEAGYGKTIISDKGHKFYITKPSIYDFIMKSPRPTQIVYPKDIGYIIMRLGIGTGSRIIEVGMGSGALTSALLNIIGNTGFIDTYERREDIMWKTIKYLYKVSRNLDKLNIHKIDFRDAAPPPNHYDAAIIDMDEPWVIIDKVHTSLNESGRIAIIIPTYNQLDKLEPQMKKKFINIEAVEISLRELQFKKGKIRPEFRMIGFTAIVVTGVKILN